VFLVGFPLLIIALAFYNMIAFLMPGLNWTDKLVTLRLMSGTEWTMTLGDALVAGTLFLLFIEVVKAAGAKSVIDHLLSFLVFGAALAEFLLIPLAATSTFAVLLAICFVDVIGGLAIRLRIARQMRPAEVHREHAPDRAEI